MKALSVVSLALGAWFSCCICSEQVSSARASDLQSLAKARLTVARKACEEMLEDYKNLDVGLEVEEVYIWSRRCLEARRDADTGKKDEIAAIQEHLDRMQDLETFVKKVLSQGTRRVRSKEVLATEFYRLEAEFWIAKARKK